MYTHASNEPIGQYASDQIVFAGDPRLELDPRGVKALRGDGTIGFHMSETLFDEGGDSIDESTGYVGGERIGLDHVLGLEGMRMATSHIRSVRQQQKPDAAELWLRDHDPDYQK